MYHYEKAIKKGMIIDNSKDTISIPKIQFRDSIIQGKDSVIKIPYIVYKDTVINISNVLFPKSKKEIKYDYKLDRKKLEISKDLKKDSIKQTAKTERVKQRIIKKSKSTWWKFYIGVIVGILITIIFTRKIKI